MKEDKRMTAEEFFEAKFGNKITSGESWVIRLMNEYAQHLTKEPTKEVIEDRINKLIKKCDNSNYNFNIQYWDGDVNIYISNNAHQIDSDVTSTGGNESLELALENIFKQLNIK